MEKGTSSHWVTIFLEVMVETVERGCCSQNAEHTIKNRVTRKSMTIFMAINYYRE
jgi:hypothetical protein